MTVTDNPCRYLVMAGGTGGHIFPALAVAQSLQGRGATVSWLGTSGMEATIVPDHNIPFHTLPVKGFRGKSLIQKLLAPLHLLRSIYRAMQIIRTSQSEVVIGFGGFVAAPGGIAARLMGKPLIIHEQNAIAGSTNKLLNKVANKTMTAFPAALPHAVHVGNPVRQEIIDLRKTRSSSSTFRVLITGGSLGAKAINDVVPHAIANLLVSLEEQGVERNVEVLHQTGKGKQRSVSDAYADLAIEATTNEFIRDMAAAYQWADMVICRAGALTVSEVAVAGVPAIFIPLPSAIDNHQYHNAKWLVDQGASLLIEQQHLNQQSLALALLNLIVDDTTLSAMQKKLRSTALPNAAECVADYCEALCASSKKRKNHAV